MTKNGIGCPLCESQEATREGVDGQDAYTVRCEKCPPFSLFPILPEKVWANLPEKDWAKLRAGLVKAVKRHWGRHATPLVIDAENWRALAVAGLIYLGRVIPKALPV
jgi:hypothetical protein